MRRFLFLVSFLFLNSLFVNAAEFRAAWVASVWNLNYPSRPGLSVSAQKKEITRILDVAKSAGLNALLVQVRPESDALYASRLEPWSHNVSGKQGASPGFDPLETFIREGRRRGIEIHAWINPFRAAVSAKKSRHKSHISRRFPDATLRVGNLLWMDPGVPAVREFIVRVVADITARYDVAGIHFDDYFYPYPKAGKAQNFPDSKSYAAYKQSGGRLGRDDWRRDNVNRLIRDTHSAVKRIKSQVIFGVSPFGIYTKGYPKGIETGVDQLHQLYADPVKWMREGWIDYLAPQLYWRDGGPQSFSTLLRWWRDPRVNPRRIPILPGIALDRLSKPHNWSTSEIKRQLQLEKKIGPRGEGGFILWNVGPLLKNTKGIRSVIASE
ncbi:MAG: glycoside hydrolase family 10 protein [Chthoniobacterales bacterium]